MSILKENAKISAVSAFFIHFLSRAILILAQKDSLMPINVDRLLNALRNSETANLNALFSEEVYQLI